VNDGRDSGRVPDYPIRPSQLIRSRDHGCEPVFSPPDHSRTDRTHKTYSFNKIYRAIHRTEHHANNQD
jgi:hypothetical protein